MLFQDAVTNHEDVPPDYYETSIKNNLGQRFWHNSRFNQALSYVSRNKNSRLLDIGSADGTFTSILVNKIRPKRLVGIDVLETSVDYANKRFAKSKAVSFLVADAHKLPFKAKTFDGVFALEVLEHVFKPKVVLDEIRRVLVPGGFVVAIVPNEESYLFKMIWWVWTKFKGKIWRDAHVQEFTPLSLLRLFESCGFRIVDEKLFLYGMLYIIKCER